MCFSACLLTMMVWFPSRQVTTVFVTEQGNPLVGIRITLNLPEGLGHFVTDEKGDDSFGVISF